MAIEITDKHFPAFLGSHNLTIASATLIVRTVDPGNSADRLKIKLNGSVITGFKGDPLFGGLPAKAAGDALTSGILGKHTIEIDSAGDLAPEPAEPGDDSALDESKLADIILYIDTQVS